MPQSIRVPGRGTPDKPRRFLIELRFNNGYNDCLDAVAFNPRVHGRLRPELARDILAEKQGNPDHGRCYHHVRIVSQGSSVVICEAGTIPEPAITLNRRAR
jgi:hypothetical protein